MRLAGEHRPKRVAAEDMNVKMRDFLPAIRTDIGEQAISGLNESRLPRDLPDGADERPNLRV